MDVITTHINADFDCLGAMVAARRLYPEAVMVFPGAQERSLRDFFLRSTVYAGEFRRLRDIDLATVTRLILVDVRQGERIGPFVEVAKRPGVDLHIYDHHPEGAADLHGSVEVVEAVGATVTVMCRLLRERGLAPDAEEATLMMLGLYEDTGSLTYASTTVQDFESAAFLLAHGANLNLVADCLTQEMTSDQVALLHVLLESRSVLNINGVDITVAHASYPRFVGDLATLAQKMREMEGLEALLVIAQLGERVFMVGRARRPEVPMGEILAEFGGGGHPFAASATVKNETVIQLLERLPQILSRHVRPCWEARHLMSTPVKTAPVSATVAAVRDILTRYNINALPLLDGETVVGVITRQVVDKAAHHGLAAVGAAEYMTREFACVTPETPVELLKELIVAHNQRFVPVLDRGRLVGAITRTDLLRHLVTGGRALPLTGPAIDGSGGIKRRQMQRLLREQLPERVAMLLRQVGSLADELGMCAYAVGGFVRDLLLHQPNLDVDVVVEGDGIALAEALVARFGGRVRPHHKFGTAVVVLSDGFKLDLATTRMEYYLEPGALPTVEHASLKLDLYRRDFTINTLAIALNGERFGELYDFFGAQRDLHDRAVRVLHNLSFVEDPTRVFRAVRFEQRLGFRIGAHSEALLRSAVRMGFIARVGGVRIGNELTAVLRESDPLPALKRLAALDLLTALHPALRLSQPILQSFDGAARALHWFELLYTGEQVEPWQVYFLCLCSDLTAAEFEQLISHLAFPERLARRLASGRAAVAELLPQFERRVKRRSEPRPSELYHWLHPLAVEQLLYCNARTSSEEVRRWLSRYVTQLRALTPQLNGTDLQVLGIPPGPQYKDILAALRDACLEGKVSGRQSELAWVRKRFLALKQEHGDV